MDLVQFALVLIVLVAAVAVISAPLRHPRATDVPQESEVSGLEAAREAKYREIRDAELDFRTGKLSRQDWEAVDRQLRSEAMEILRQLDRDAEDDGPGQDSGGQTTS